MAILFNAELKAQTCNSGTTNIPPYGTVTVNGVKITSTSTGHVSQYPWAWTGSCASVSAGGLLLGQLPGGIDSPDPAPFNVKLNFDKPVNDIVILITGGGSGYFQSAYENFVFNANNGTISISSSINCGSYISGNTIYSRNNGGGIFRIRSTQAYSQLTISGKGGLAGSIVGICSASVVPDCPVATLKPSVKNISNSCPSTTVNLNEAHTGSIPSGSVLRWFTNSTHSGTALTSSQVLNAGAGTYYAFYYESTNNCYSSPSDAVTVSINTCPPAGQADLTVGIQANPVSITLGGTSNLIYTFANIGQSSTNGSNITCFISKPTKGTLEINNLNQPDWTISEISTGYFISSNRVISPGVNNTMVVNATYKHSAVIGPVSIDLTATVINGSGGEINDANNTGSALIKIN